MITITKERLLKIKQWRETYGPGSNVVLPAEEAEELARIALASLEAEPVAWRYRHHNGLAPSNWKVVDSEDECNIAPNYQRQALYTVPPAPVSMKDHQIRELVNELRDIAVEYHGTQQLRERIARTIRAAMLQGAEQPQSAQQNIPKIFHSSSGFRSRQTLLTLIAVA